VLGGAWREKEDEAVRVTSHAGTGQCIIAELHAVGDIVHARPPCHCECLGSQDLRRSPRFHSRGNRQYGRLELLGFLEHCLQKLVS